MADNQFSTLGVVLVAVLARVGRVVGLPEPGLKVRAMDTDVKALLASSIRETRQEAEEIVLREYVEDTGKVVERRTDMEVLEVTDAPEERGTSKEFTTTRNDDGELGGNEDNDTVVKEKASGQETESVKSQTRPTKRRKKGNVIDDLFGDLV